jgi:hypothetical protein
MNVETLWKTRIIDLKNLPSVVERIVRKECDLGWMTRKFSPRILLLGLYICYQNERKRTRNLENGIQSHRERIQWLNERIKQLEQFEKNEVYSDYKVVITTYHWSCGGGCCSDSWAHYQVFNQFGVVEYSSGQLTENSYRSASSIAEEVLKEYGPKIHIEYDDNYSGESEIEA